MSNISPDPENEYFADGMTDEMISTVSKIDGLEVIARTSIMQYKKNPRHVKDVSRDLSVGTILEGSVRKAGNKLGITVQLIDTARDKHLWSNSYDREIQNVFTIQTDIAESVADHSQTTATRRETRRDQEAIPRECRRLRALSERPILLERAEPCSVLSNSLSR